MVEERKQSNSIKVLTVSEEGSSWEVGGVLKGLSYDYKNKLGAGAMGEVYVGECVYIDDSKKQVAVKKLKNEIYETEKLQKTFE
jgi:serine/threonine protein kinase